jgi:5'-methylthioadenosine phosphorylase
METIELAVIGGSGLYAMAGLTDIVQKQMTTPFGEPSDAITVGTLHGRRVAFLPRHGRGHLLTPTTVPYRANIYALKMLGVKYIVAVSACGSLREDYAPGHMVVPDQLYDNTKKREMSFFDTGLVAHVGVADPFSPELGSVIAGSVAAVGGTVHEGGTFITIEGPRFSTKGESNLFRRWGMSLVGMTTSPEAFLAREAEMAYAVMAHVTDYDVWHESEEAVSVEMVIRTVNHNTGIAKLAIAHMVETMGEWAGEMPAHFALKDALLTNPNAIDPAMKEKLNLLMGRYL